MPLGIRHLQHALENLVLLLGRRGLDIDMLVVIGTHEILEVKVGKLLVVVLPALFQQSALFRG